MNVPLIVKACSLLLEARQPAQQSKLGLRGLESNLFLSIIQTIMSEMYGLCVKLEFYGLMTYTF